MKNLILIIIITLPLTLWGQVWEQTYGGENDDGGYSVQQTTDGGYVICGFTGSFESEFGDHRVYLIKTDENGNEQWYKTFGGKSSPFLSSEGYSVQQTSDGGYIITGFTEEFGSGESDVYLIKTDENGNEIWSKTYGGIYHDCGRSVQQTSDGGYIITGWTYSLSDSSNVYLLKTDENGIEEWGKNFGGLNEDYGRSVQQTSDGGYIITGWTYSFGSGNDVCLIKTDENGNEIWSKTYGGIYNDFGRSVQQTSDGGYIITGWTYSFGSGNDVCLIKTDENGNEIWSKIFSGEDLGFGESVQQTSDGGYIITGSISHIVDYNLDVYLIKTDENGNEIWSKIFGGEDYDEGNSVQQTSDGGYIITGYKRNGLTSTSSTYLDVYLIKTDDQGNITSTFEIPLPNPDRKLEKTINLKGQEVKPQTNTPIIEIFDDGTVEKKLIIEK